MRTFFSKASLWSIWGFFIDWFLVSGRWGLVPSHWSLAAGYYPLVAGYRQHWMLDT